MKSDDMLYSWSNYELKCHTISFYDLIIIILPDPTKQILQILQQILKLLTVH